MILIDNNQVIIANLFSLLKHNNELDENLLRHMILNTYRMYRKKFHNKYGELVICNDSRSWRKDIFENYKANRKKQKDKSDMDWNEVHNFMDKIREEWKPWIEKEVTDTHKVIYEAERRVKKDGC